MVDNEKPRLECVKTSEDGRQATFVVEPLAKGLGITVGTSLRRIMLSQLEGPEYLERVTVNSVAHVRAAKKAIKKAFQNQIEGKGFSLVEVVSSCPTNWGMTPKKALEWIDEKMIPYYPLGVYKDRSAGIVPGLSGKEDK